MKTISRETPTGKEFLSPMGQISVSLSQLCKLYKTLLTDAAKLEWKETSYQKSLRSVCVHE